MSNRTPSTDHHDVLARVKRVFSMGILTNVLTLVTNFLLPPYFLSHIGVERYGAWLYLFSIPMSLAMCDLGISAAFSTEVYRLHANGQREQAAAVFKTGIKILAMLMAGVFAGAWVFVAWWHAGADDMGPTILLLSAYVLSGYFSELLSSAYKIEGRYEFMQVTALVSKVAELGALLWLAPGNNFPNMAAAMLAIRVVSVIVVWCHLAQIAGYLLRGNWREWMPVRHLFWPAIMYAVNPLIMFVALQVPLLVIGGITSMATVVAYTTTRTMARLPLQISSQISFSLYTEYTRLYSSNQLALLEQLYRKSVRMILGMFGLALLAGQLLGVPFYEFWLNRVPTDFHLLFAMLFIDALFESVMRNKIALSSSLNVHARDTLLHLVVVSTAAGAMYLGGLWFKDIKIMLCMSGSVVTLAVLYVAQQSLRGKPIKASLAFSQ
ncbi:MAG: hypothetical protein QM749_17835 [Aquabacterium sp.]